MRVEAELANAFTPACSTGSSFVTHVARRDASRYILQLDDRPRHLLRGGPTLRKEAALWIGPTAAGSTAGPEERRWQGAAARIGAHSSTSCASPTRPIGTRTASLPRRGQQIVKGHEEARHPEQDPRRQGVHCLAGRPPRLVHAITLGDVLVMRKSDESLTVLGISKKRRACRQSSCVGQS